MTANISTPRVFASLDALAEHRGEEIGCSGWCLVEQSDVDHFAELTRDRQWIHVDVEAARQGPYGAPIAHGYLTLALIPALSSEAYRVEGVATQVNYGAERVRFPAPVTVGSKVRGTFVLTDIRTGQSGAQVRVRATVEVQGQPKPACVADTITLVST